MAKLSIKTQYELIPEGWDVFKIYEVEYDESFGVLKIHLVNADGKTFVERFGFQDRNGNESTGARNAFSYFAKCALNDMDAEEVDTDELVGKYIKAEIKHVEVESNKGDGSMRTFANLGDKEPADGFEREACEKAQTLGTVNLGSLLD